MGTDVGSGGAGAGRPGGVGDTNGGVVASCCSRGDASCHDDSGHCTNMSANDQCSNTNGSCKKMACNSVDDSVGETEVDGLGHSVGEALSDASKDDTPNTIAPSSGTELDYNVDTPSETPVVTPVGSNAALEPPTGVIALRRECERLRHEGNDAFKRGDHAEALAHYDEAIARAGSPTREVALALGLDKLFSNRAAVHLQLEKYGGVIADCSAALELAPDAGKALYRRAKALTFLKRYEEAERDYLKMAETAQQWLGSAHECRRLIRAQAFQRAISKEVESVVDRFRRAYAGRGRWDADLWTGPDSPYKHCLNIDPYEEIAHSMGGSTAVDTHGQWANTQNEANNKRYAYIAQTIKDLKDLKRMDKDTLMCILLATCELLADGPAMVDTSGEELVVVGDIHGQFYDWCQLVSAHGTRSRYLFNGDLVDRGLFCVEVLACVFLMKLANPRHVYVLRGNHETSDMNLMHGFHAECLDKYDLEVYKLCSEIFERLPVAARLSNRVFVCHGGIPAQLDLTTLKGRRAGGEATQTPQQPYPDHWRWTNAARPLADAETVQMLLWADPTDETAETRPSKRGVAHEFGANVTTRFLRQNSLQLLIRSHELKMQGHAFQHGDQVLTVFSAPNYCDQAGNTAAVVTLDLEPAVVQPHIHTFQAVPHPNVKRPEPTYRF